MAQLSTPHVFFTLLRRSLAPAVVDPVRPLRGRAGAPGGHGPP